MVNLYSHLLMRGLSQDVDVMGMVDDTDSQLAVHHIDDNKYRSYYMHIEESTTKVS